MANHLARTLATFETVVHRSKNRLVSIPADVQKRLALTRRQRNHIVLYSIRKPAGGRWNHHLAYLTQANEFAIPADVTHLHPGDRVEVKLHRFIPDGDALDQPESSAAPASVLQLLGERAGQDVRTDGSQRVDEYLCDLAHG
jgi:hypothetical protein